MPGLALLEHWRFVKQFLESTSTSQQDINQWQAAEQWKNEAWWKETQERGNKYDWYNKTKWRHPGAGRRSRWEDSMCRLAGTHDWINMFCTDGPMLERRGNTKTRALEYIVSEMHALRYSEDQELYRYNLDATREKRMANHSHNHDTTNDTAEPPSKRSKPGNIRRGRKRNASQEPDVGEPKRATPPAEPDWATDDHDRLLFQGDSAVVTGWLRGSMESKTKQYQDGMREVFSMLDHAYDTGYVLTPAPHEDWARHVYREHNKLADAEANYALATGSRCVTRRQRDRILDRRWRLSFDGARREAGGSSQASCGWVLENWHQGEWTVVHYGCSTLRDTTAMRAEFTGLRNGMKASMDYMSPGTLNPRA